MKLSQFKFKLPPELIAERPTENRDESRLMVLNRKTKTIEHRMFRDVLEYFDDGDTFIINNTRVFPARMYGNKEKTGAKIEVFLLRELNAESRLWDVLVDPARKIRIGNKLYFGEDDSLVAEVIDNTTSRGRTLRFLFDGPHEEFKRVLYSLGETPIPKFINREPDEEDVHRFQTVFAKNEGAVAAPTAGLHITDNVIQQLKKKQINMVDITLHVGLGTFKPYEADTPEDFLMHTEKILIPKEVIEHCREFFLNPDRGLFISVGTTSCRTMESVFWFGVQLLNPSSPMWNQSYISMQQWTPYSLVDKNINAADVFAILLTWMDRYNLTIIEGETQLMIIPGYSFGITEALITNFHQPKSTLLFLVSAFLGVDIWKQSYEYALKNDYRFLSYGDSSLLLKGKIFHANSKPVL